jgi:DivIVA domain-containing protein
MGADPTSIERIRSATFKSARRGYKKQDVDRFLASLADWMASGEGREQSIHVKEALQDVGRRTGKILTTAEEAAQEIRDRAQQAREEADAYAKQARENADQQIGALKESSEAEAERIRTVAARDAEELISKAKADARAIEEEGKARKAEIEAEIGELRKRRGSLVEHLDQLARQLSGTADDHRPSGTTDEFAAVKPQVEPETEAIEDGANGAEAAEGTKSGKSKRRKPSKAGKSA